MTVCIAGICLWNPGDFMIVGASDRMITAQDVQFEPDQPKIYVLAKSAVALLAGDPSSSMAVCDAARARIEQEAADGEIPVRRIVDIFTEEHAEFRGHLAELANLRPLGLDRSWLAEHSDTLAAANVRDFDLGAGNPTVLIAGRDSEGGHLWQINKWGLPRCDDLVGFSAIGMGEWHAGSHLMTSGYTKFWFFQRAMLAIYEAKRKAEVAPGIGRATDLFYIGHQGVSRIREDMLEAMRIIVDEMNDQIRPIREAAIEKATDEMNRIMAQPAAPPATSQGGAQVPEEKGKS